MINKNVLVYGATGGIGQAICRELQTQGANIYLIARSEEKIKRLVTELNLTPSQTLCITTITTEESFQKTREWLMNLKVNISVGIHCAGFGIMKKAAMLSLNEWKELIDVNLNSAFAFFRIVWEMRMMERCELVYFGSASTDQTWQKNSLYGASKAGLELFAKSLQKEIMNENGRVWLYKPGSVLTPFFDKVKNHLPREKMILPEDLAKIVVNNLKTDIKIYFPYITLKSD